MISVTPYVALNVALLIYFLDVFEAVEIVLNTEKDVLPDCNGVCSGQWAMWTNWSKCKGGECHSTMGRQSRQRDCHYLYKPPTSRGDYREEKPESEHKWLPKCRQKAEKECISAKTCAGKWAGWGAWTECFSTRNGTCRKTRRRLCLDNSDNRMSGSLCLGGFPSDTGSEICTNHSCKTMDPKMALIPNINNSESVRGNDDRNVLESLKPKNKNKGRSHNMILIIAVSVGSLMLIIVFILLMINLVRTKSSSAAESNTRGRRWKRIGSSYTASTVCSASYAAASDFMSARTEFIDIRSPSAMAGASGSSSLGTQAHFFARSDSRTNGQIPGEHGSAAMLIPPASGQDGQPPRRSRLLQENVYWEISDAASVIEAESNGEHAETADLEVVQNVLYGSTAA